MLDLEPAAQELTRLLPGIGDDQLDAPTPCEGTPVAVDGHEGRRSLALLTAIYAAARERRAVALI